MKWIQSLKSFDPRSLQSKPKLRHDLPWIKISDIAEQYYCEFKVELSYSIGEVSTQDKEEGIYIHQQFEGEKIEVEQLIQNILKLPIYLCAFPVYLGWEGIVVGGSPDGIFFFNSKPRYLIELKTTSGSVNKIWDSEIVQAELYGLGLEFMGFDCSQLDCIIVKLNRKEFGNNEERIQANLLKQLIKQLMRKPERKRSISTGCMYHLFEYSREDAIEDLKRALGYWRMERNPIRGGLKRHDSIPVNNANKCKKCEFNRNCSKDFKERESEPEIPM